MTQIDLVRLLQRLARDHQKRIFTLREIAVLGGVSRPSAAMTLIRAERKGLVSHAANCWFNRLDPPTLTDLAFALVSPSYLSFESSLYHHGILSQSPRGGVTVATAGRPRRFETVLGDIHFIHLKSALFFGYDQHRIAYPEKAWLDLLYIRGRRGGGDPLTEEFDLTSLNKKRLLSFERRFPAWVRKKRTALRL